VTRTRKKLAELLREEDRREKEYLASITPEELEQGASQGTLCGDCGAPLGTLHFLGCDCELCPICGGQAMTCEEHCCTKKTGSWRRSFFELARIPFGEE
jgi:hypothetical protein